MYIESNVQNKKHWYLLLSGIEAWGCKVPYYQIICLVNSGCVQTSQLIIVKLYEFNSTLIKL